MRASEQRAVKPIFLMLLIVCAFYATTDWIFAVPFTSLFAAAVLCERVLYHWFFWTLVTALLGFSTAHLWLSEGNHLFLLFYVALTALVASHTATPRKVFRQNARLMIGLVFGLATLWKVASEDYVSSLFYAHLLITDDRLGALGVLFTDLSRSDIAANQQALLRALDGPVQLITSPGIHPLAVVLTWLTVAMEATIAVVFLGNTSFLRRLRSLSLLVFLLGTYTLVPVPGFGTTLACLGYAETSSKTYQMLFLLAFILMPLTSLRYYLFPI